MSILAELTVETGVPISDLLRIIVTAPRRYKVYLIPKKDAGYRTIAQPSRELKVLQRFLLSRYLGEYPIHPAAMAYVKGRNIYENAAAHAGHNVFLKLDFKEFFPSIRVGDWKRFLLFAKGNVLKAEDAAITAQILFWGRGTPAPQCLSIGAPTSPMLSNILLYQLDTKLALLAETNGIGYTRYADDITVSGRSVDSVLAFEKLVRREVARMRSPKLTFNDEKRGLFGRGQRRMVTGLIVTPSGQVSIGRGRKRMISAMLHQFSLGQLDVDQIGILKGLLGFTIANEATFVSRMREKYGGALVDQVLRTHIQGRTKQGSV